MDTFKPNLAEPLGSIASALYCLGVGNAYTDMGAIELLAMETKDGTSRIADALSEIASENGRIADAINNLAEAVTQHGSE